MPQCVIIADDLTGGNATCVLMAEEGYRTYCVIDGESLQVSDLEGYDCVCYPTDSRALSLAKAYDRVFHAALKLKAAEVKVYSKRIDSTLRGNLGSETDAILDALGDKYTAMVVPCFPSSGRITVGGYQLVNALPLHLTEAASDPKNPIHTPLCAEIYMSQSKYPVGSIELRDLTYGACHVAEKICELAEKGVRTIIFDAVTQQDIDLIADSVIKSGVPFATADPGVFTAAVTRRLVSPGQTHKTRRILAAVGSVNAVAGQQVSHFLASCKALNVYMETAEFLESEQRRQAEIDRVVDEITRLCDSYDVCSVVGHGIIPQYRVPFEPYSVRDSCSFDGLSEKINSAIAEIVFRIVGSDKNFDGIYTCGGDITVSVCRKMKSSGLRLISQVLPLAAYGRIVGGEYGELHIVTKGGMVGDADAMIKCISYLREKLSN